MEPFVALMSSIEYPLRCADPSTSLSALVHASFSFFNAWLMLFAEGRSLMVNLTILVFGRAVCLRVEMDVADTSLI